MLSAHARGLGTCRVGSPLAWLKTEDARTTLRIPEGLMRAVPRISGAGARPTGAASTADHLGELSLQPRSPHEAKRKRGRTSRQGNDVKDLLTTCAQPLECVERKVPRDAF
jgi:hypothetical protein